MSGLETLRAALLPLGVPVYPQVYPASDPDEVLPDDYIIITPVYGAPDVYAGDTDEYASEQLRASWYSRGGNTGHASRMRAKARALGFMVLDDTVGYDAETKHYIAHQEFLWVRGNDDNGT